MSILLKAQQNSYGGVSISEEHENEPLPEGIFNEVLLSDARPEDYDDRIEQIIPTYEEDKKTFKFIKKLHGNYPKQIVRMGLTEAEMVKYYSNIFNAMRVIFANEFYETCQAVDASYNDVKAAFIKMGTVPDQYLDVNENFRGYGGVCLPKDVKAIVRLQEKHNVNAGLFRSIDYENTKYKTTVFGEMRLK